ncbi:MAG: hypothetical protein GX495_10045 [Chloroflexi bacterium]|jgi:hypothetical protein|nr:hypothetical protein [Chloroflexota bacterium]
MFVIIASFVEGSVERQMEPGAAMLQRRPPDFPGFRAGAVPGMRVLVGGFPAGMQLSIREGLAISPPPLIKKQQRFGPLMIGRAAE